MASSEAYVYGCQALDSQQSAFKVDYIPQATNYVNSDPQILGTLSFMVTPGISYQGFIKATRMAFSFLFL